jgi:hypothetical protein
VTCEHCLAGDPWPLGTEQFFPVPPRPVTDEDFAALPVLDLEAARAAGALD